MCTVFKMFSFKLKNYLYSFLLYSANYFLDDINNVKSIKRDLSFVLIETSIKFEEWTNTISGGSQNYLKNILSFEFNVIIFDNLYQVCIHI